mgnify:CR=1 FL=1
MSYWTLAANFGFGALKAYGSEVKAASEARAAITEYKINRKAQEARNRLHALSTSRQLNANLQNQIFAEQDTVSEASDIQRSEIAAQGDAIVNAAAAGVSGSSVAMQLQTISANAARLQDERLEDFQRERMALNLERDDIEWAGIVGKDRSVYLRPSTSGIAMSTAGQVFKSSLSGFLSGYATYKAGKDATSIQSIRGGQ